MKLIKNIEWTGLLGLICSAIGGVACVVSFAFLTFQTKSEAQAESGHTQAKQTDIQDEIHSIRESIDHLHDKVDVLLENTNARH